MSERTRGRTVRVPIDATVTRPGGRGQPWLAEAGTAGHWPHWRAEGGSEKAAVDTLTAGLRQFVTQYRPPSILTFRGYVAVVSLDLDGAGAFAFRSEFVRPDGHQHSSSGGAESWDAAEAHARHTLAQLCTDWHDDASVQGGAEYLAGGERFEYGHYGPEEFYRYAAWQRAAKAAMDAGRADWHELAGEHAGEFRVPRPGEMPAAAPAAVVESAGPAAAATLAELLAGGAR